jgi:nicotinamide-nucleotide amidase
VKDEEGTIVLTFTVRNATDPAAGARRADALLAEARERLGRKAAVIGPRTLPERVLELLVERGRTVSTAESCTGGRVAAWITSVAGSSAAFREGVVAYHNDVKMRRLGVPEEILAQHGAVSEACARAMATGARERAGTDYAVAVTGVAGPGGGSAEKPVGLVHFALAGPSGVVHLERRFAGDRGRVQVQSAATALDLLRLALEDEGASRG